MTESNVPSNLRLAEARDIVASGTSGKSLPVIEFIDAQQAEIERLNAVIRHIGSHIDMQRKVIEWCDSAVAEVNAARGFSAETAP